MRDPYEVLGVPREASPATIKSAFRKLAKKLHPDANKSDPKTAARFSELNAAYEILGDETKRKAFDRGEIDAEGKPRFRGFEGVHPGGFGQEGGFEAHIQSWQVTTAYFAVIDLDVRLFHRLLVRGVVHRAAYEIAHRFQCGFSRREPMFDVVFNRFDHNDRIVHN